MYQIKTKLTFIASLLVLSLCAVYAQSERALQEELEGRNVQILIDMPASSQGIDVRVDKSQPIDFDQYSRRIKDFGTSIYSGDVVMITKVKKKKKHIELQLAGGGFGTMWDESDHISNEYVEKSSREVELESLVKDKSRSDYDELKRELDNLRRDRRSEQDRLNREVERDRDIKKGRIEEKRLRGGSRFNIRFDYNIGPEELTMDRLKEVMAKYIAFDSGTGQMQQGADKKAGLAKGISIEEAIELLGLPKSMNAETSCGLEITTCEFANADQVIKATFAEKVLVKYAITSQ